MKTVKMMRVFIGVISGIVLLAGCEKEKIPFSGERKPILTSIGQLTPDPALAKVSVQLPKPLKNRTWDQAGFEPTHVIPHLQLSDALTLGWKTNIGVGSSDEQRLIANLIAHEDRIFAADTASHIICLEAQTGKIIWNREISTDECGAAMIGGMAFSEGALFITSGLGEVIALGAEGNELWRHSVSSPVRSAPTVKDGRVFVTTINNELHALDAKSGNLVWNHTGTPEATGLLGGSSPAIQGNTMIVTYSSGEVYALDVRTGEVLWTYSMTPSVRTEYLASIPHIRARPLISDNAVYLISHGQCMVALDLKTGSQLWQQEIGGIRTPALSGNYLFLIEGHGNLVCVERQHGRIVWVAPLPQSTDDKTRIFWSGPVLAGDQLILYGTNGEILFCSPQTGQKVKSLHVESSSLLLSPVVLDGTLLALADNGDVLSWH